MADSSIGSLPRAETLQDDSLFVMEQGGEAQSLTGGQLRTFAEDAAASIQKGDTGPVGPPGPRGPMGYQGLQGENFKILGYFASLDELNTARPEPSVGDAYGIGTEPPYNIYVFDGVSQTWVDNGSIQDAVATLPKHADTHAADGDDPITLESIGAFSSGGGELTGDVLITRASAPSIRIDQTTAGSRVLLQNLGHSVTMGMFEAIGDLNNGRSLYLRDAKAGRSTLAQALELYDNASKVFYQLFGTHNRPATVTTYNGNGTATKTITVPNGTKMVIVQGHYNDGDFNQYVGPAIIAAGQNTAAVVEHSFLDVPGVNESSFAYSFNCTLYGTGCTLTMSAGAPVLNQMGGTYHVICI